MKAKQDWLKQAAQEAPQQLALIHGDQSWDYLALDQAVTSWAGRLLTAGVRPGQHIGVLMPNRAEWVFLLHALARIGAVLLPLNIRLTAEELSWQAAYAETTFVIFDDSTTVQIHGLGSIAKAISLEQLQSLTPDDTANWDLPAFDPNALQSIVFTSGTTGFPKGAALSYANHSASAQASAQRLGTQPNDRWLLCMPLYHVGGMAILLRSCFYRTATILLRGFDERAVLDAIDAQKATIISLVPTMLARLLSISRSAASLQTLRLILLGGAAADEQLLVQAAALDLKVGLTYGLSEAASQVSTATPEETRHKPGTVGKPLVGTSVKIVDQGGSVLPAGEIGEVLVSGPTLMQGYYLQLKTSSKTFQNDWLHTGDLGYLDLDGDLWLVQRRVDLIISGGENIYPSEVEKVLLSNPSVAQACVVGLPDEEWGQQVAAAVVLEPGQHVSARELVDTFCRQHLAGYKIPRQIIFYESLPLTASGKIQRRKVCELVLASIDSLTERESII
ncbi:MAG: o-succinylbenzoate--CoA ligase [Chloroflexi bacterium]|nr:o-succinylbenzoate--CoA ligase [Chloroflexota bacterium]MBT3670301.1 o-succinylbenzoate--CoA ligase [Chloroflexota bacterium]MBT4305489.1 o-succinylbenzoate--CoA ligase [Chloroflexota bacterium]MBT4533100.1 o-succinylbenzoate--CoA ligase [Chloroflexota bacterium]MBT4682118.1 o-succinylbenzoate--CoA ligase [Chloroflexota bacterium]